VRQRRQQVQRTRGLRCRHLAAVAAREDPPAGIVLRLLRASGRPEPQVAVRGSYQLMLAGRTAQLVRLRLRRAESAVPEISANKYALNIRFTMPDTDLRPKQSDTDIPFELTFCNL
jgi:cell division protein ZapD